MTLGCSFGWLSVAQSPPTHDDHDSPGHVAGNCQLGNPFPSPNCHGTFGVHGASKRREAERSTVSVSRRARRPQGLAEVGGGRGDPLDMAISCSAQSHALAVSIPPSKPCVLCFRSMLVSKRPELKTRHETIVLVLWCFMFPGLRKCSQPTCHREDLST